MRDEPIWVWSDAAVDEWERVQTDDQYDYIPEPDGDDFDAEWLEFAMATAKDEFTAAWKRWTVAERVALLQETGHSPFAARRATVPPCLE